MSKNNNEVQTTVETKEQAVYTKEQILQSARFKKYPDILAALMTGDGPYDLADIDRKLKEYLKRGVK